LENKKNEDNEVSRRMWKAVETKAGKTGMAKVEKKKRKRKEAERREKKEKKVVEKCEIWDEKKEAAKSEEEDKKLASQRFHKWIHFFGKKVSERMPMKKMWDYAIELKEGFIL